jgi:hypothetical protein
MENRKAKMGGTNSLSLKFRLIGVLAYTALPRFDHDSEEENARSIFRDPEKMENRKGKVGREPSDDVGGGCASLRSRAGRKSAAECSG